MSTAAPHQPHRKALGLAVGFALAFVPFTVVPASAATSTTPAPSTTSSTQPVSTSPLLEAVTTTIPIPETFELEDHCPHGAANLTEASQWCAETTIATSTTAEPATTRSTPPAPTTTAPTTTTAPAPAPTPVTAPTVPAELKARVLGIQVSPGSFPISPPAKAIPAIPTYVG